MCNISTEKGCWSTSNHSHWFYRHHWYMGASRGRASSVSRKMDELKLLQNIICTLFKFLLILSFYLEFFEYRLEQTRHVSMISIVLSVKELDTTVSGYLIAQSFLFAFLFLVSSSFILIYLFLQLPTTTSLGSCEAFSRFWRGSWW